MKAFKCSFRSFFIVGLLLFVVLAATPSWAAFGEVQCGDTIGPNQVAVLTNDLTCDGSTGQTALTVQGPKAVLKMAGHTVTCDGIDLGIVLEGSGAVLVGGLIKHGTVTNCRFDGVLVAGTGGHHVTKVTATLNSNDGFEIVSSNNELISTRSIDNNFGYFVPRGGGNRNTFKRNLAKNNQIDGFILFSDAHTLTKNQALSNSQGDGFELLGNGLTLKGNVAKDNGNEGSHDGFCIDGDDNHLVGNLASGNGGSGFHLFPGHNNNLLRGNIAKKNQQNGIRVGNAATNNTMVGNIALGNTLSDLRDDNFECDNNTWKFNWFKTSQTIPPDAGCIR